MKKSLLLVLSLIIILAFYLTYQNNINPKAENFFWRSSCDTPINYTLGTIDPKFGLTQKELLADIKQAADIWDQAYSKPLFVNSSQGLTINLVYDERQSLTSKINNLQDQLNQDKNSLNPEIQAYQQKVQDFKTRLQQLNQEIEYWNSHGGAPKDQYDKLIQEQQDLKNEADSLNATAKSLNLQTQNFNSQVNTLNSTVQDFNQTLQNKPEEGLYNPQENKIDIYFNISQKELVHTLAHELGHSLGLEHNSNPKSIMYPQTNQSLTPSPEDLSNLQQVCQKHNLVELAGYKLGLLLNYYQTLVSPK